MGGLNADVYQFIEEMIRAGKWELRRTSQGYPYAALPDGFGNGEKGVRLHFVPYSSSVIKVIGVVDYWEEIGIKRLPTYRVSLRGGIQEAINQIRDRLIPKYQKCWYKSQPKIKKWLEEHKNQ